jgi:hypothetical protein
MLGFAADMAEAKNEKEASDILSKAMNSIASNLTSKTYLQGLADAAEVISKPDRFAATWATDVAGSQVPNIIRRAAIAIDPVMRDTKSDKSGLVGLPDRAAKTVASRLPGISTFLPARKTMTGANVERSGSARERFASPSIPSSQRDDRSVEKLIAQIGGDALPSTPRKELTATGGSVKLSDQEYARLTKGAQAATKHIEQVMKAPRFGSLPDPDADAKGGQSKEKIIRRIYEQARQQSR